MKSPIVLESIAASLEDARAAARAGADRFEVCGGLAVGGLTPSLGLLRAVKRELEVSALCMIRPRECGMAYSQAEFETMLEDAQIAIEAGADGLVFGFLTPDGEIDAPRCRRFVQLAGQAAGRRVETVFHRAFDVCARPDFGLEQLIDLGVTRILTSGRAATALRGAAEIRRVIERARGRIEILPGGGIGLSDLTEVLRQTGADQIHVYLTREEIDPSASANPEVRFAAQSPGDELGHLRVDQAKMEQARKLLAGLADQP